MARLSPWAVGAAAVVTGILLLLAGSYGFHRDELYFIAAGRHPALGFVDQPPLTPLLSAAAIELLGETPVAIRILPALLTGLAMVLCADMARRFGGGTGAQVIAALALATTGFLAVGHLGSTTTYDAAAWTIVLWLVVILLAGGDRRLWLLVGVVAGIGLENKYIVVFLGLGLAAGILLARRWDVVRSPWAWAAIAIALLLWAPNLAWQAANDWPQLEMARILAVRVQAERGTFLLEVLLIAGSLAVFVPVLGVIRLLVAPDAVRWRAIGWAALVVVGLVVLASGKSYYMAGTLAALVAAGSVTVERWIARGRTVLRPLVVAIALVLSGALAAVIALPLVPLASLGSTPITEIYGDVGEQVGWPELVAEVTQAVDGLSAAQRAETIILTTNYGQAGALELLGEDLPPVFSGHNSYWDWGPPPDGSSVAIIVAEGDWRPPAIGGCEVVGVVDNGLGVENDEQGTRIEVCRNVPADWNSVWSMFRHLS